MKAFWLFLLLTLSLFVCGAPRTLPSVEITRYLESGGTDKLFLKCEPDRTVVENASCWLTLRHVGTEVAKKNLRLAEVDSILASFFQRVSKPSQKQVVRDPADTHIAFRWEMSTGAKTARGEIRYGDGSENDAADAALSVEFLLQSKFLE
jgi:hypothetical protein